MASFQKLIQSDKPVLVDFFAEWCGPCKAMKPILEDLKKRVGDSASIIKVDVDRNPHAAQSYQIQGVHSQMLFKNCKVLWRKSGVVQSRELEQIIQKNSCS
jgi:thioredoxin 1